MFACKHFAPGRIIWNGNYIIWTAYPLTGILRSFHNCIVNDNVSCSSRNQMIRNVNALSLLRHTFLPTLHIYSNSWSRAKDRRLRYETLWFHIKITEIVIIRKMRCAVKHTDTDFANDVSVLCDSKSVPYFSSVGAVWRRRLTFEATYSGNVKWQPHICVTRREQITNKVVKITANSSSKQE